MSISHRFPGAIQRPTPYFGYPNVSSPRRIEPTILGVIHCTDGYSVPKPGATKSWTFSVDRSGTVYQFLDPVTQTPWTNGDIKNPDTSNPLVAAMVGSKYNPNEFCFLTIENVAYVSGGQRLTQAQLDADRAILRWGAKLSGLPMDRKHVIGHYQVNGSTRVNCPTVPADRQRVFNGVLGMLPNTAVEVPSPDMDIKGTFVNHIINKRTRIVGDPDGTDYSNARLSPSVKEANDPQPLHAGTVFIPVLEVIGTDGDNAHWFLGMNYYGARWQGRYVRGDQLVTPFEQVEASGFTREQLDEAEEAAKAAGVKAGETQEKTRIRKLLGL